MANSSRMPEGIRAERSTVSVEKSEPIRTFDRTAIYNNRALYANLPDLASNQLDIGKGDDLSVEVFTDKVVIRRGDDA